MRARFWSACEIFLAPQQIVRATKASSKAPNEKGPQNSRAPFACSGQDGGRNQAAGRVCVALKAAALHLNLPQTLLAIWVLLIFSAFREGAE